MHRLISNLKKLIPKTESSKDDAYPVMYEPFEAKCPNKFHHYDGQKE